MPQLIKQIFFVLVSVLLAFRGSLSTKCISMNNHPCMVRPTLIDLNPDEIYCHLFIISMSRCYGNCNTVKDPFGRIYVSKKREEMNLKIFKMIKGIKEFKTLAFECRFV